MVPNGAASLTVTVRLPARLSRNTANLSLPLGTPASQLVGSAQEPPVEDCHVDRLKTASIQFA
jgi:hypothetical protein